MFGYIYMTTNLINNKKYIGQHKGEFTHSYLGSGKLIGRAIDKYGKENFTVEILCICVSKDDMINKEKEYIKLYNANTSSNFYNISSGGEWGDVVSGMSHDDLIKYRDKLSKAVKQSYINNPSLIENRRQAGRKNKNKKHTVETKNKISKTLRDKPPIPMERQMKITKKVLETKRKNNTLNNWINNPHPWIGRKHTDETKKKIAKTVSEKTKGINNPRAEKVYLYKNDILIKEFALKKDLYKHCVTENKLMRKIDYLQVFIKQNKFGEYRIVTEKY